MAEKMVSIVIPMHNEEEVFNHLLDALDGLARDLEPRYAIEAVMVDDGSTDGTWDRIAQASQERPWISGVRLSRNFGHQVALTCGHHFAVGDAVVDLDADLQDPPGFVPEMIAVRLSPKKNVQILQDLCYEDRA